MNIKLDLNAGHSLILLSLILLCIGSYATLFSAFTPATGIWILDTLAHDTQYKYWLIMLIPTTTYFVIANWVGWQYYRNS
ncbi:hypothetical protein K439DRAFT_1329581 [Ramaria rubella]|nr:hypothetical protein K439DRAFT_1329581 [Ramaria rubella]